MSLLSRLEKYKPTSNVSPEENFFTEALTYTLESDHKLTKELLRELNLRIKGDIIFSTQNYISNDSIIDLLIEDDEKRILIEIKLAADLNKYEDEIKGTIDQLEKYQKLLNSKDSIVLFAYQDYIDTIDSNKYSFQVKFLSWEKIHDLISKRKILSPIQEEFIQFMKYKSMSYFEGLGFDYFKSIGTDQRVSIKAPSAVRKQFNDLCQEVLKELKISSASWTNYIYSFDYSKNRFYSHYQNPEKNNLGLNINLETTPDGIGVLIWIPYWSIGNREAYKDQGKINSKAILHVFDKYSKDKELLAEKLQVIFNDLDSSFLVSLHAKQYEHLKSSTKKAQGMQKGYSIKLIEINKGNTLIPRQNDNTLMLDIRKEVYDNVKDLTSIHEVSKIQLKALVDLLYDSGDYKGLRKSIILKKQFPISYCQERGELITQDIQYVISEFNEIIRKLNLL